MSGINKRVLGACVTALAAAGLAGQSAQAVGAPPAHTITIHEGSFSAGRSHVSSQREIPQSAAAKKLIGAYDKLPLAFEANQGQIDPEVRFLSRGSGYTLFLTRNEAVLKLRGPASHSKLTPTISPVKAQGKMQAAVEHADARTQDAVLRMKLVGAKTQGSVEGLEELPGKSNYITNHSKAAWHTDIPNYAKVRYSGVYPGVDLIYYGHQRQLEYDFVVKPGADASRIRLGLSGAAGMRLASDGSLILQTAVGPVRWHKPVLYQETAGIRTPVAGSYSLKGANQVGFQVASYNHSKPLVIDPVLMYSTYAFSTGGVGDMVLAAAVDASGNGYVTGLTASTTFGVTAGAYQTTSGGGNDAFVSKLNASGSALVYSTYLGGSANDYGYGIAVDTSGDAFVAGITSSSNFPTTVGAAQPVYGGGAENAFVAELNPAGSGLIYSSYLGGSGDDGAFSVAVDSSDNAYVAGFATSANFPTTPGALQTTLLGTTAAFAAKLTSTGALVYSTLLGGVQDTYANAIAVDSAGSAYLVGTTDSPTFLVTPGALSTTNAGGNDGFVSKLNPAGSGLVYSTLLGGSGYDEAYAITVSSAGNAYVAGHTHSTNFPTTAGAFRTGFGGGAEDAFVTELNAAGTAAIYSTYLGGSGDDTATGIALDSSGNAYVAGFTSSTDFPQSVGSLQSGLSGGTDAFLTMLNPSGSGAVCSTYMGGSGNERTWGIALDAARTAMLVGDTTSSNFPVTGNALQNTMVGTDDGFVSQITSVPQITGISPANGSVGSSVTLSGMNFENISAVTFNGAAASYRVDSPTQVTAMVPTAATSGPVSITSASGTGHSAGSFTLNLPVVSSFTPGSGPDSSVVTITGSGLTGATSVKFGSSGSNYVVQSDTQITAYVPWGASSGPISVTTSAGTGVSGTSFVVPAPSITNITPNNGPVGTQITVTGVGFTAVTSVTLGGMPCNYNADSDTQLRVYVPVGAPSGVISITTPAGTGQSTQVFTVH